MATAAAAVDQVDEQRSDDQSNKKRSRPPNKRKHEEQIEEIMNKIRPLEEQFKFLRRPTTNTDSSGENVGIREQLLNDSKKLREEKDAAITKRKTMDQELQILNDKIRKMSDSLSKLEAGLKFKKQSAIEDAIRKLDHQLQTRHFTYNEENRIVREIDSLRRSKKKVKEYLERRKDIDEERAKKTKLKSERDKYFFMVSSLKKKEDAVRQKLMNMKSKEDEAWNRYRTSGAEREALKKEIDSLYEQKRQLIAEFRQQLNEYHEQAKIQRAESLRKREEEKKAMVEAKQKAWDVYEASLEPYEEERHTCSALIKYLQKFQTADPFDSNSQEVSPVPSPSVPNAPSSIGNKEFTVLKKKSNDEDEVFLPNTAVIRRRRSQKRSRKPSWINKPLRHSAQIFSQFTSLGLSAPTTPADLAEVMDQLYVKKEQYKEFSKSALSADHTHRRHLSGSSSLSTSSLATSDIDSSLASNITSIQSDNGRNSPNITLSQSDNGRNSPNIILSQSDTGRNSPNITSSQSDTGRNSPNNPPETRTHSGETKDSSNDSQGVVVSECKTPGNCHEVSVPKIDTKLSALKISAAQSLQAKKCNESVPLESQSHQSEFALLTHRLEPETTGDGGSSSSATESTLPETPLSDMSAPFDSHSGDGLDSGIDETRGGKIRNEDGEELLSDQELDNKPGDVSDLNANNPIIGSTSQEEIDKFLLKQDKQRSQLSEEMEDATESIHASEKSQSFQEHQSEQPLQDVTISENLEEVALSQDLTL